MQVNTQMDIPKNSIGNFHDSHSSSGNRYASVQFGKVDSEREDSIDINAENKGAAVNRLKGLTITAATSLQEQLLLYFEYEFLTLLPAFMINRIDKEKNMRALPNLAAKFRCVEAFIFGSVVLAFIIGLGLYSL